MRHKKTAVAVLLLAACIVFLAACSANNLGLITPADSESKTRAVAFEEAGISIGAAAQADASIFTYRWRETPKSLRLWADVYKDGQLVGGPIELTVSDLSDPAGTIALFTDEVDGVEQKFTLLVTNGTGENARAHVKTGTLEVGQALSPAATLSLEDAQVTEVGEENILLVMHDAADLDSEMSNDLNQTAQLIDASTYTLVLRCTFS